MSQNQEISYKAIKRFAERLTGKKLFELTCKNSETKVLIPQDAGISVVSIVETFDEEGLYFFDQDNNNILDKIIIVTLDSDVNENGNYLVEGVRNGTLVIENRSKFTEEEIAEMLSYN